MQKTKTFSISTILA